MGVACPAVDGASIVTFWLVRDVDEDLCFGAGGGGGFDVVVDNGVVAVNLSYGGVAL